MSLAARSRILDFCGSIRANLQFSRIFLIDLVATAGYVLGTAASAEDAARSEALAVLVVSLLYALLHAAKILLVVHLEKRGGDAREFVGSLTLVVSGPYAHSRNPVYLLSLIQSAIWSLLLALLAQDQPAPGFGYALSAALLYGHFWGMDRLVIPHEEAALRRAHRDAFDAYAGRVRRWIGRYRARHP